MRDNDAVKICRMIKERYEPKGEGYTDDLSQDFAETKQVPLLELADYLRREGMTFNLENEHFTGEKVIGRWEIANQDESDKEIRTYNLPVWQREMCLTLHPNFTGGE